MRRALLMRMDALQQRIADCLPLATAICRALRDQAAKLGFDADALPAADVATAVYRLEQDRASGSNSLVGEWKDRHGYRIGMLLFHGDGSFFAEHDIVKPHPDDSKLFVEAVEAWGRGDDIRCEPRVMPGCEQ